VRGADPGRDRRIASGPHSRTSPLRLLRPWANVRNPGMLRSSPRSA